MKRQISQHMAAITAALLIATSGGISNAAEDVDLSRFIFEQQWLPKGCTQVQINFPEPDHPIKQLPRASDDPMFVQAVAAEVFRGSKNNVLRASVEQAVFSLYKGNNEVSAMAFLFDTEDNAKLAEGYLAKAGDDAWRDGRLLAHTWADRDGGSCYVWIKGLVGRQMGSAPGALTFENQSVNTLSLSNF